MGQEKKQPHETDHMTCGENETPQYQLVDTQSALIDFARTAAEAEMVAVDLEADSMFHYQEKVCLVQMAANGTTVVIDPLKVNDLSPLKTVFGDSDIVKVFHGADYDIRSLYRDFGITINNMFDTQLACMYLGHPATSLESIVACRFGVVLNKKYQKKDWSQRPLPEEMVAYAASDVIYLIPLAKALQAELTAKGRLSWVMEGCLNLSRVRPPETGDQPMFTRFRGAGRLSKRQLAVLEALLHVRDSLAQQKDRPLFKVLNNSVLLKIAMVMPVSIEALKATQVLTKKQLNMYGQALSAAVVRAMQLPSDQLPAYPRQKIPRVSPRVPPRVKGLKEWRDILAAQIELDPALILNKSLMREIAQKKPKTISELEQVPGIYQWQVKDFGEHIISVMSRLP